MGASRRFCAITLRYGTIDARSSLVDAHSSLVGRRHDNDVASSFDGICDSRCQLGEDVREIQASSELKNNLTVFSRSRQKLSFNLLLIASSVRMRRS